MKTNNLYGLLLCSAALFINNGCTTDTLPTNIVPHKPELPHSALTTSAGANIQVILPTNFVWLSGSYSDNEVVDNFVWKKISGPSNSILETPNSLRTKVSNLEKGIYEFELTVMNKKGITAKDTVAVTVGEISISPKEIIFKDLTWICPWGCIIEIKNIYSYLPSKTVFRVYIQRDNSDVWEEAIMESQWTDNFSYLYTLNGNLTIHYFGDDVEDTPNIKIVY